MKGRLSRRVRGSMFLHAPDCGTVQIGLKWGPGGGSSKVHEVAAERAQDPRPSPHKRLRSLMRSSESSGGHDGLVKVNHHVSRWSSGGSALRLVKAAERWPRLT